VKYLKIFAAVILILLILLISAKYYFNINPPFSFTGKKHTSGLPLDSLSLPPGFVIEIYADSIENARSMCLSPSGTVFVGNRSGKNVYALKDTDGDQFVDKKYILLKEGNMPNGVAFKDGHLYVAEVNRILKFENIESKLSSPGKPIVIYDKYPTEKHHGWKYIAFGPDNKLYVPVGAPCNICESADPVFNSITRMNEDGSGMEIVHSGIRNTVGFTWHPVSKQLWFTDNGRDLMGDEVPECELNMAPKDSLHFGYPYCHQGDIPDPEFGMKRKCSDFVPPVAKLGPHTAPLGLKFYSHDNFPQEYTNSIFVARHGSWNRSKKSGYDIVQVVLNADGSINSVKPFITGWLNTMTDDVWGRPVDILVTGDGSLLISDDYANVIYRVYYKR
jgi:glucose/arabinose dehydrogenase